MAIVQPLSFGLLLRRLRIERGLTQEQLAERSQISANAIAALETGARKTPRRATLDALAQGLALSPHERVQLETAAHPSPLTTRVEPLALAAESAPFVGRAAELAQIERFLASPARGARICAVAGEPGIGKSRLLYEAISQARVDGWTTLDGGCYRQDGEAPSSPWPRVLMRFLARRTPAQQRLALQSCSWLARLLPELADSGVAPLPAWNLPPEQERRLIHAAVGRFLANIAGPVGTLLALDDLQWAGADALTLLATLARETHAHPLKILIAYRDTEVAESTTLAMLLADLTREGTAGRIALQPLGTVEARELLGQLLTTDESNNAPRPEPLTNDLLQRADGVPFFLVSCAADLRSRDSVRDPDGWRLPHDVAASVRQRFVALSTEAQQLLRLAAVAGRVTHGVTLLAAGTGDGMSESQTLSALEEACRSGLIVVLDDGRYAFAHDLLHEVIVTDLSAAHRRLLHRRIADALEQSASPARDASRATELSWHLDAAGEAARALPYTLQASEQAAHANALVEAERLSRRALELARAVADEMMEARALEGLGALLYIRGRFDEAAETLKAAIALYQKLGVRDEVAVATQRLARTYNNAGMVEAGVETLRRTILFLTPEDDEPLAQGAEGLASRRTERALASLAPAAAARLGLTVSKHLLDLGNAQRGLEVIEQAERQARIACDSYTASHAHSFRGDALDKLGRFREALATWREAIEMTRQAGNLDMLIATLGWLAQTLITRGELREAKRCAQEALKITTTQFGDVSHLIDSYLCLGEIAFIQGEWQAARDHFGAALASATSDAQFAGEQAPASLARIDIAGGRITEGLRALHHDAVGEGDDRLSHVEIVSHFERLPRALALAEYELFIGSPGEAEQRLQALRDAPDARFSSLPGLLAQAYILQGRLSEAETLLNEALPDQRAGGLRLALIESLAAQASLDSQLRQWNAADHALNEALDLAREIPAPYMEVKLLARFGEIAQTRQRPAEARQSYARAAEICDRLGERLYRERIQRSLDTLDDADGYSTVG